MSKIKNKKTNEQIDYGDYPERMHPSIQNKLERGDTPYSKHPAMPKGEKNFDQIVASKRFKDIVDKFAHYAGSREQLRGNNAMMNLMMSAMKMVSTINQIEQRNKTYLENLAIDLVTKQMSIPKGKINYIAELVPYNQVSAERQLQGKAQKFDKEEIENAFKENAEDAEQHVDELLAFEDAFEKFDLEKAKRRFMNSLIQGAAKKGHYMFELVKDELERIDPRLLQLYGLSQSTLDYLYWLYPEEMVMRAAEAGEGQAGIEDVDVSTSPPTVKAKASTFPVLLHELVKGTYEVLAASGLPTDPRQAEMVVKSEDTATAEIWDVRLGPVFWEKFLESYPNELFDDDKIIIQNYLFSRFSMLSTKEFMNMAKMVLSGSDGGKKYLQNIVNDIIKELKEQEYEETMGGEDDTKNDDDLNDFLSGLGIHTT